MWENNLLSNRAEAVAAGDFIAMQLPKTEATVRQAEVALRQFKETKPGGCPRRRSQIGSSGY